MLFTNFTIMVTGLLKRSKDKVTKKSGNIVYLVLMFFSRILFPISAFGTVIGSVVIIKEFLSGGKYLGVERIPGKTVIITGANTGIGKATAMELARRGARIILACRNVEKAEEARMEIIIETSNCNISVKPLDLASAGSIQAFAKNIIASEPHVDILINNAGVMRCPKMLTDEGFEMQLGVNHLGHFLLTMLLLDKLKSSAPSRIINVSSIAYQRGQINFDDLNSSRDYSPGDAYSQSKLANVLFTRELARKLEGSAVTVNAVHPGLVRTEIGRHMPINKSYISSFFLAPAYWLLFSSPLQGARTSVFCAVSAGLEGVTGKFFSACQEKDMADPAMDDAVARRLWAVSEKWTRLS